jgi:hypothetical protein
MATQTLAAADAILKDLYVGPVVEQLNYKTYMIDQIERDSQSIDHTGRRAVCPIHSNRNRGRGSRGDGGNLPAAGTQTWQDAIVHIRYNYSAIEVTDGSIKASQSNEGAFVNILDAETKGCANDLRKDVNRQVFGTGDGLLSQVAKSQTTTNVLELESVQYVAVGDPVSVLRKTDGSATEGVANVSVKKRTGGTTKTIEISTAVSGTVDTGYGVYLTETRNQEMDGLRNIIKKNRTLHEINSETAGNEFWNGNIRESGTSESATAVAGESVFELAADDVGFSGQGEVEVFLTSRGIRRRLADTYQAQKRYNDAQAVDVHGGYSAIMVNEVPVISDDDAPRHFAFGLNRESLRWFQQSTPGWMEQGGGGVFHLKDGSTAGQKVASWQAFFSWYAALGCVAPNRNAAILYCTDDSPV